MKIIVGLGNVGEKYSTTRHNVGFLAVEAIARAYGAGDFRLNSKLKAACTSIEDADTKLIFAKPTTMMNDSGRAVRALSAFYKVNPADIIVCYDEVDLSFGEIRVRESGRSAGHKGISSVIDHIGPDFTRIRIGIGDNRLVGLASEDYVLQPFNEQETGALSAILDNVVETVQQLLKSPEET